MKPDQIIYKEVRRKMRASGVWMALSEWIGNDNRAE